MMLIGGALVYGLLNIGTMVPGARLEEGARDIGALLSRLSGMAVFQGESYFMEYDLDEQRYRIYRPSTLEEQDEGADEYLVGEWHELPRHVRFLDVQFSDRQKDSHGLRQVEFTATGEVTGHLVHLISDDIVQEDENRFTVELNPITGLVSYERGEKRYQLIQDEYAFR